MKTRIIVNPASDTRYTIARHLSVMEQTTKNRNAWCSKDRNLSSERPHKNNNRGITMPRREKQVKNTLETIKKEV